MSLQAGGKTKLESGSRLKEGGRGGEEEEGGLQ